MNHPASEKDLFEFFEKLGITVGTHRHPPVFTVDEAQSMRGSIAGGHCKTLLIKDKKKNYALIVADEGEQVDLKYVAREIGMGRISFASADRLFEMLGVTPGSVTPFSLINRQVKDTETPDIQIILDARMMENSHLNYHPLHNEATCTIVREDLIDFIKACGYTPRIMPLQNLT